MHPENVKHPGDVGREQGRPQAHPKQGDQDQPQSPPGLGPGPGARLGLGLSPFAGGSGWLTWASAILRAKSPGTAFSRAAAKKVLTGPRTEAAKP